MRIQLTKEENKRLRWLLRVAKRKKYRSALSHLYVANGVTMACCGHVGHVIKTPADLEDFEGGATMFDFVPELRAADTLPEVRAHSGTFPDLLSIVEQTKGAEVTGEFYVNAKYLREALDGMGGGEQCEVRIVVHSTGRGIEVFGKSPDGEPVYAVVMPLNPRKMEDGQPAFGLSWRPSKNNGKE